MRKRPVLLVLSTLLLLLLALRAAIWASNAMTARTAADPGRASAFLQNYSPEPVVHAFAIERFNSWASEGRTSEGGDDSVRNDRQFRLGFAACGGARTPLTAALEQDLMTQLRQSKATILMHTGTPQTGVRTVYQMGRTLGVVHLQPVRADGSMHRATPLPPPVEDMAADLSVSETWYRTDQAASSALRQTGLVW